MAQIRSLAQELLHAVGLTKNNNNNKDFPFWRSRLMIWLAFVALLVPWHRMLRISYSCSCGLGYRFSPDSIPGPRNFHMPWVWLKMGVGEPQKKKTPKPTELLTLFVYRFLTQLSPSQLMETLLSMKTGPKTLEPALIPISVIPHL